MAIFVCVTSYCMRDSCPASFVLVCVLCMHLGSLFQSQYAPRMQNGCGDRKAFPVKIETLPSPSFLSDAPNDPPCLLCLLGWIDSIRAAS